MATPIPHNDAAFTLSEIVEATGGELLAGSANSVRGVATDTRQDLAGRLFVALRGERFDGHAFVAEAVEAGARAVLVSDETDVAGGAAVVRVRCTLSALGALGRWHRLRWGGRLVAIGGSAGKTTTRAAAQAALEVVLPGAVHATLGNMNNRVGVPMTLLGLEPRHRVAVVEVGTNVRGEVAELGHVTAPDLAVLTLIELEHTAGLGDIDGIEQEEGDLFRALRTGGIAIANGDDSRALRQLERCPAAKRLSYGTSPQSDYRLVRHEPLENGRTRLVLTRRSRNGHGTDELGVEAAVVGLAGGLAITAALAVAESIAARPLERVELEAAVSRLGPGEPGRLRPVVLEDGTLVLDDSYNSNPASARASLTAAREIAARRGSRLVVVLGEMRELGRASPAEHTALGESVEAGEVLAVGGDAGLLASAVRARGLSTRFVQDAAAAAEAVLELVRPGDVVLVKGSRGVGLERVVERLAQAGGRAP
ncbi:MAG: UDP-N-acetylmuramoyl-tripeptide--D-alanyl-D-alanine ligase [Polyangiaceae bacterium]|nr:UDP-N-acetylmuramoyl-tripeptide--D-alanyl-D-alanine ligase [Polyangiaceae bacterium]